MSPKFKEHLFTEQEIEFLLTSQICPMDIIIAVLGRNCWEVIKAEGGTYAEQATLGILEAVLESISQRDTPDLQKTLILNLIRAIARRGDKPYNMLGHEEYRILCRLNLPSNYRADLFVQFNFPRFLQEDYVYLIRTIQVPQYAEG